LQTEAFGFTACRLGQPITLAEPVSARLTPLPWFRT